MDSDETDRSLRTVKEDGRQLIQDDQGQVEHGLDMSSFQTLQPFSDAFMHSGGILFVQAVPLGEGCDDCLLVQDPHPHLVDHENARHFADVICAAHAYLVLALFLRWFAFALVSAICLLIETGPSSCGAVERMWRIWSCESVHDLIAISIPCGLQRRVIRLIQCTTRMERSVMVQILSDEHFVTIGRDGLIQPGGVD